MRQKGWRAVSCGLLRSWRWSGTLFFVLCLMNVPSLVQRDLFEGASLALLPRAGLLAEEAVRVAGLSLLVTLACGFLPRGGRRLVGAASVLLALVDAFTLRQYHSVLDAGLLEVVAATNPAEALEYVTSQARAMAPFLAFPSGGECLTGAGGDRFDGVCGLYAREPAGGAHGCVAGDPLCGLPPR